MGMIIKPLVTEKMTAISEKLPLCDLLFVLKLTN